MQYKRQEPFRHVFNQPIDSVFQIVTESSESKPGEMKILDISPSGLRMFSKLDLPSQIRITAKFTLMEQTIDLEGLINWKSEQYEGYEYGVECNHNDEKKSVIIDLLKAYQKAEHGITDNPSADTKDQTED